jgi:hypothetical protein
MCSFLSQVYGALLAILSSLTVLKVTTGLYSVSHLQHMNALLGQNADLSVKV